MYKHFELDVEDVKKAIEEYVLNICYGSCRSLTSELRIVWPEHWDGTVHVHVVRTK